MLQQTISDLEAIVAARFDQSGARSLDPDAPQRADGPMPFAIHELEERRLVLRHPAKTDGLRPGGIWSGPSLVAVVDLAGYLMTVAHQPVGSDAYTLDMALKYLQPAPFGELTAEVGLLRLTGRSAYMQVSLYSPHVAGPVLHSTVTFAST